MIGTLTGNGHDLIKLGQEMELINEVPYLMNAGMKILKIGLMRDVRMVALAQKPSGSYVIGVISTSTVTRTGKSSPTGDRATTITRKRRPSTLTSPRPSARFISDEQPAGGRPRNSTFSGGQQYDFSDSARLAPPHRRLFDGMRGHLCLRHRTRSDRQGDLSVFDGRQDAEGQNPL